MKAALFASLLLITSFASAGEVKKFTFNADAWELGDPPKDVFVVDGTVKVAAKDGNKAIMIDATPIVDASAQLAVSAAGDTTIQAKIFGTKRARSSPRFGVSVHGMSGYRLIVNAAKKTLELVKADQSVESVPFTWTADAWTYVKLEVKKSGDTDWTITGKVWPADGKEPTEPMIKHSDKGLKGQGKAGIWGTPYSETPIYFDEIEISLEVAAPAAP